MKLNNRGFAISSIMYIILVMCIILITLTLSILSSRNLILDKQKKETLNNIYNEEGYNRPSIPRLIDGLTPIKYNGNNWVVADTSKEWYNYSKQEWANAVILNNGVTKDIGQTVNVANEIKAMFVWIPRYEYKIEGVYGKGGSSASLPGEIEVRFVSKNRSGLKDNYRVHPAFTFGDEELSGIWVGKFETSTSKSSICYTSESTANCDNTNQEPYIIPNANSLRYQKASTQFATSQKFNSYITNGDSHMMKNSEWGAVAYLSQSKYGKYGNSKYSGAEKKVRINNCSSCITGIGANSQNESASTSTCTTNTYETVNGQTASTTGNVTGIYDMSGGAWEHVMGYLSGVSSTWGAASTSNYAGFTNAPNAKYYDLYTSANISSADGSITKTACNGGVCYGHALSETTGWYGNGFYFIYNTRPWSTRGSGYTEGQNAGLFYSGAESGKESSAISFRIVISPLLNN